MSVVFFPMPDVLALTPKSHVGHRVVHLQKEQAWHISFLKEYVCIGWTDPTYSSTNALAELKFDKEYSVDW